MKVIARPGGGFKVIEGRDVLGVWLWATVGPLCSCPATSGDPLPPVVSLRCPLLRRINIVFAVKDMLKGILPIVTEQVLRGEFGTERQLINW